MAAALTPAEVLADLIAEGVRRRRAPWCAVRDVPAPDPIGCSMRWPRCATRASSCRIAYLREGGQAAAEDAGFTDGVFSTEIEQAERWRNERDLRH